MPVHKAHSSKNNGIIVAIPKGYSAVFVKTINVHNANQLSKKFCYHLHIVKNAVTEFLNKMHFIIIKMNSMKNTTAINA